MKLEVIQNLEDFLNDFQYFKIEGFDAFQQIFEGGSKIIVTNIIPYEDGVMMEVQLAIKINEIEKLILNFHNQYSSQLSLTYWEYLNQVSDLFLKRSFIQNKYELSKSLKEIENALVKNGFSWLDKLTDLGTLSEYLYRLIFYDKNKSKNLFKLSQRSYLLRIILKEQITEARFYDYYEVLQANKIAEHQLEEFLTFKKYLDSITF
jgi:hypothetical protein